MTKSWNTKYGPRRVREEPPTLEDAVFAARGSATTRNSRPRSRPP